MAAATVPNGAMTARIASSPSAPDSRGPDGQGLLLSRTMLSDHKSPYVGRFACDWPRLSTTDPLAARRHPRPRPGASWPGTSEPAEPDAPPVLCGVAPSRTVTSLLGHRSGRPRRGWTGNRAARSASGDRGESAESSSCGAWPRRWSTVVVRPPTSRPTHFFMRDHSSPLATWYRRTARLGSWTLRSPGTRMRNLTATRADSRNTASESRKFLHIECRFLRDRPIHIG